MYTITAKTIIKAPIKEIWEYMIHLDNWWVDSSDEHISLKILSKDKTIKEGTKILIKEKIAGVPGEIVGRIHSLIPYQTVTWESDKAVYKYFGLKFKVKEGVKWSLKKTSKGTELSAHVWAEFPGFIGKMIEFSFKHILNGVERDYQHAIKEVLYVKKIIESKKRMKK